ncbi:MAG TPA: hypothetical protein VGJ84_02870 [Polyangiaceae bacterium]|jgi:hypothetical protein
MTRADAFCKAGFWVQLVLLVLVDWGTLAAFRRYPVPVYHYVGFAVVNLVLLSTTFVIWSWLRDAQPYQRGPG